MAKYKKRPDGRYAANIVIGKDSTTGKRIYAPTLYATSVESLDRKKSLVLSDLGRGTYADDKNLTVKKWAEKWIETYKTGIVANSTLANYKNIIKNHLISIENIRLKDLKKSDVQMQINSKSNMPEVQRMLKITLNQMLEDAIDDNLIYKNVCRGIRLSKSANPNKRPLNDVEKKAIINCDFSDMEKVFVYILLFTGMRRSEVLSLTVKDIDFTNKIISVNKSLSWSGGTIICPTKSITSNRTINIPDSLVNVLRPYVNNISTIYLFTGKNGSLISQSTYKRFWNTIYNKINNELGGKPKVIKQNKVVSSGISATDLTPHTFRHNYATMLYYGGIDIKEAQRLLGHSSIKVTLEIYTHLIDDSSKLSEKINNAMNF